MNLNDGVTYTPRAQQNVLEFVFSVSSVLFIFILVSHCMCPSVVTNVRDDNMVRREDEKGDHRNGNITVKQEVAHWLHGW